MITLTQITEVHAARIAERDATIASQAAENERLRDHIKTLNAIIVAHIGDETRAALQPKEGEG